MKNRHKSMRCRWLLRKVGVLSQNSYPPITLDQKPKLLESKGVTSLLLKSKTKQLKATIYVACHHSVVPVVRFTYRAPMDHRQAGPVVRRSVPAGVVGRSSVTAASSPTSRVPVVDCDADGQVSATTRRTAFAWTRPAAADTATNRRRRPDRPTNQMARRGGCLRQKRPIQCWVTADSRRLGRWGQRGTAEDRDTSEQVQSSPGLEGDDPRPEILEVSGRRTTTLRSERWNAEYVFHA